VKPFELVTADYFLCKTPYNFTLERTWHTIAINKVFHKAQQLKISKRRGLECGFYWFFKHCLSASSADLLDWRMFNNDWTRMRYEGVTSVPLNQLYTVCLVAPVNFATSITGKSKLIAQRPNWLPSVLGAFFVVFLISSE